MIPRTFGLAATLAVGLAVPSTSATAQKERFKATPLEPTSQVRLARKTVSRDAGERMVPVIVKLAVAPVASYRGGVPGLAATSPALTGAARLDISSARVQAYASYVDSRLASFEAASRAAVPKIRFTHRFGIAFGGLSAIVPEGQIDTLRSLPGVSAVFRDQRLSMDTARSPQFLGAKKLWRLLGGQASAGEGVIFGSIDSGVWPELASFSDPDANGNPLPAPPAKWTGTTCDFTSGANPGDPFTCNNKLIGAYRFMTTYEAVEGLLPTEFTSARDDDGHGSHTASTVAGNSNVEASVVDGAPLAAPISGVAPRAHVVAYKVCGNQGCYGSDSVAAINQAIADGIDVINFSISGGSSPYSDAVSIAFLDAYDAGIFVAASAGNSGPGADTVAHREPWTTTVAASTSDSIFLGNLDVYAAGKHRLYQGLSVTGEIPALTPLVLAADYGDALCLNPFPPATFSGEIVVCQRGTISRYDKSKNVAAGGAGGLVLYNANLTDTLNHDKHYLPSIHISSQQGTALLNFLAANPGPAQATLSQGVLSDISAAPDGPPSLWPGTVGGEDIIASLSSRGGIGQTLGISKPDLNAPGIQILAGGTPEPAAADSSAAGAPGLYNIISGTSMASPHVAGSAALLKALHPDWTPWQIKSALMTTAKDRKVFKEDGVTPADAFDFGSGRVLLTKAGTPGLTLVSPAAVDFEAHADDLWNVNYPSIYVPALSGRITVERTLHSELTSRLTWTVRVKKPRDLGVTVPASVTLPAGGDRTISITIDASKVPLGEVRFATLKLVSKPYLAHLPIVIVRRETAAPLVKVCDPLRPRLGETTDCTISVTNTTFDPVDVSVTDVLPPELRISGGVTGGVKVNNRKLTFDGTLAGGAPMDIAVDDGYSPAGGYLPMSLFAAPFSMDDEEIANFSVDPFVFAGKTWSSIGMVSNGYAVVGGLGSLPWDNFINQDLPDPYAPNTVLAPFWTDLDGSVGGNFYAVTLTDGTNYWLVLEWEGVPNWDDPPDPTQQNTFQLWIGQNGVEDISFAYGTITSGSGGNLTVGAENEYGNSGDNYYVDGTGTLPVASPDQGLVVTSSGGSVGETHVISLTAKGVAVGRWENCAEMTSDIFAGTSLSCVKGKVRPLK